MARIYRAVFLALTLSTLPALADHEEEITHFAHRFTAAATGGDVAAFADLLYDPVIAGDPVLGVLTRSQALNALSHSHMPPDVSLGALDIVIAGCWAMLRMPWQHPAIQAGHIEAAGCCLLLRTDDGWKAAVVTTMLKPLEGALLDPELLDPYEEQTKQLDLRLAEIDHAVGTADLMAVRPMSHPESLWVGEDHETGEAIVVGREGMLAYAAHFASGSTRWERVPDSTDAECVGLRCASVVRTYGLTTEGGPIALRVGILLCWSPQEREWLIIGAGTHVTMHGE